MQPVASGDASGISSASTAGSSTNGNDTMTNKNTKNVAAHNNHIDDRAATETLPATVGDQLLVELGRMLKENSDYKSRNQALQEELCRLKQDAASSSSFPTNHLAAGRSSSNNNNNDNDNSSRNMVAALQHEIVALQGKQQATEQILKSAKAENEKLLETMIQVKAENMILREQQQQQQQRQQHLGPLMNHPVSHSNAGAADATHDNCIHQDNNGPFRERTDVNPTTTTTATVEELQDTIAHLQNRLMHQVEEKLTLQTKLEALEHLLTVDNQKGAANSNSLSSNAWSASSPSAAAAAAAATSRQSPHTVPPPLLQQTSRQADIIREAMERKKSKNLRTRISTKISADQKIDVQAYQDLYQELEKQKRLEQRIRQQRSAAKKRQQQQQQQQQKQRETAGVPPSPLQTTESSLSSAAHGGGSTSSSSSSLLQASSPKEPADTPLNKIGTQHLTTRLWDFDDWEVRPEKQQPLQEKS